MKLSQEYELIQGKEIDSPECKHTGHETHPVYEVIISVTFPRKEKPDGGTGTPYSRLSSLQRPIL